MQFQGYYASLPNKYQPCNLMVCLHSQDRAQCFLRLSHFGVGCFKLRTMITSVHLYALVSILATRVKFQGHSIVRKMKMKVLFTWLSFIKVVPRKTPPPFPFVVLIAWRLSIYCSCTGSKWEDFCLYTCVAICAVHALSNVHFMLQTRNEGYLNERVCTVIMHSAVSS